MSDEAFADLKEGMEEALAFERRQAPGSESYSNSGSASAEDFTTSACRPRRWSQMIASRPALYKTTYEHPA